MRNFTVGKKIIFGFVLILMFSVALGIYARSRLVAISEVSHSITEDNLPGVIHMTAIRGHVKDSLLTLHTFFTAAKSEFGELENHVKENRSKNAAAMEEYSRSIFQPRDKELYEAVNGARGPFVEASDVMIGLLRDGKAEEAAGDWKARVLPQYEKYSRPSTIWRTTIRRMPLPARQPSPVFCSNPNGESRSPF